MINVCTSIMSSCVRQHLSCVTDVRDMRGQAGSCPPNHTRQKLPGQAETRGCVCWRSCLWRNVAQVSKFTSLFLFSQPDTSSSPHYYCTLIRILKKTVIFSDENKPHPYCIMSVHFLLKLTARGRTYNVPIFILFYILHWFYNIFVHCVRFIKNQNAGLKIYCIVLTIKGTV